MTIRAPALAVALAVLVAGCGAAKQASVASLGTTSTVATTPISPSRERAAACFRSHGFNAYLGSAGSASGQTLSIAGVLISGGVDPSSPQFESAMQACRKYLPGGGPPTATPAERAAWASALARFAVCVRRHGVANFPDPNGQGGFPPGGLNQVDFHSTSFHAAYKACRSLLPSAPGAPHITFPS